MTHLLDTPGFASADVLELGCAPGGMLEQLHGLRPEHRYRGIDIAEDGLEIARERLAARGIVADLTLGDIRTAVVEPADLVVSFGLAEHFTDPADAMRYHRRFVRPGGWVAVTVPNYTHPLVGWAMRWFSPETLATHNLAIMSPRGIRDALDAAGFTGIRAGQCGPPTMPNSRPWPGPRGTGFKAAARAWNALSVALPDGWPWAGTVWATARDPG
jgi:SAM-dependent methyltransferase